ncbi:XRE family transcriptional regulator [Paenibacillus anaericanus]|uniref:XRE family transcriptional regulator n=1 Tax=Paenibacillus anaericanus TaxID=170367 RepID=A0A3S1C5C5_9BACL|nr:helix-turn-helix transcriptional regulator [Paenibacillus anaericanus]RUT43262.1 XRE family transcriptional regulator [Paenibacillus anaericanus]
MRHEKKFEQTSLVREECRMIRLKMRIKLREVADHLGCELEHVSRWENGKVNFSKKRLIKYIELCEEWQS